jgi:Fe-S cluster assembly protein SufB
MDTAVREYPWVEGYFMKVIPPEDNKFAALHGAVWSGGTFIWIPPGVEVAVPLQAYYRMQTEAVGQFEHTLIVAEPGSSVHYIEGCSAPRYARSALHSGMVEIFAKEGAKVRFTTIQNWSKNVYNLNNKRALAHAGAAVDWVSASLGSKVTMLYPTTVLLGPGARTENLAFTFSQDGMWLDSGARALHRAPDTTSRLISRSVVQGNGKSVFRGTVHVSPLARGAKAHVECSTLLLTPDARTETIPTLNAETDDVELGHEATVGRVSQDQLFYLMSRGLSEAQAMSLIVNGFVSPILKEIPLEYSVELKGLLEMSFERAIG